MRMQEKQMTGDSLVAKGSEGQKKMCKCVSCGREVEVTLHYYGGGYIGNCPECKQLAYNGKPKS